MEARYADCNNIFSAYHPFNRQAVMSFPNVVIEVTPRGLTPTTANFTTARVLLVLDQEQTEQLTHFNLNNEKDGNVLFGQEALMGETVRSLRIDTVRFYPDQPIDLGVDTLVHYINRAAKVFDGGVTYMQSQFEPATKDIKKFIQVVSESVMGRSSFEEFVTQSVRLEIVPAEDGMFGFSAKFIEAHTDISKVKPADLAQQYPASGGVFSQIVKHPVDGIQTDLSSAIMDLNDEHKWTFSKIADWLETLDININIAKKEELK